MFINEIGSSYANENLYGAHFVYDGKVYRMEHITTSQVTACELGTYDNTVFPAHTVTGWRTFKYPRLGYRRITNDVVGTVIRQPRSYTRGLSYDNLMFEPSPLSWSYLNSEDEDAGYEFKEANFSSIIKQALMPEYDGADTWQKLKRGEIASFVPSHNVLCEAERDGRINVYISDYKIGVIRGDVIKATAKNIPIIENIVRKYAS